jgi:hypothetical protein
MTKEEVQALQIEQLSGAIDELRRANRHQQEFNTEIVKFMAQVTTWGKVGMLLWSVFAALLVWAITRIG